MTEIIRISEQGKRQLIALKRSTKIDQWNVLCRWALCNSLLEETPLRRHGLGPMSNIEITWTTFCGPHQACIDALLENRIAKIPEERSISSSQISLCTAHLHRGIGTMANRKPNATTLIKQIIEYIQH